MNKRNSIILALLFVIMVVEIIVLAPKDVGIAPSEDVVAASATPGSSESGQIMRDVHLVQANAAGREWELWAQKAVRPKEHEQWTIAQVKVRFFGNNGVTYTVTGQKGDVVPDKNDIHIQGNVETRSSNGYVFKTESVYYDSKKRILKSPQEVQMTGPGEKEGGQLHLTGAEMLAHLDSNEISIEQNVRAKREITGPSLDNRVVTIQSQRALFSGKSNLAQFFGNVVIDIETMRITGPEAKFSYDPKTSKLESVQVTGGTRVTDTDKFATSGSVDIHFKDDKVIFRGSPRVVQNDDELVGDEITFLDGGKRVKVSNAKAQIDPKAVEGHQ